MFTSLSFSLSLLPSLIHLLTQVPLWRRCLMMRMIYFLSLVSFSPSPYFLFSQYLGIFSTNTIIYWLKNKVST